MIIYIILSPVFFLEKNISLEKLHNTTLKKFSLSILNEFQNLRKWHSRLAVCNIDALTHYPLMEASFEKLPIVRN